MLNKFSLIVVFTLVESFLLLIAIPQCSDTANYLSHPGFSSFSTDTSLAYTLLHYVGDNKLWFKIVQFMSFSVFNISSVFLPLSVGRLVLYLISPFFLSIIGLHYWACSIRSGLSISFLMLYFAFSKPYIPSNDIRLRSHVMASKIINCLLILLSVFTHWASIVFFILIYFLKRVPLASFVSNLVSNSKFKGSYLYVFATIIVFAVLGFIYSKTRLAAYTLGLNSPGYGNSFPYIALFSAITYFILFFKGLSSPNTKFITNLNIVLVILSTSSLIGLVSPLIIRITSPLQFIIVVSMIVTIPSFSRLSFFLILISPPFIYYAFTSYLTSYS